MRNKKDKTHVEIGSKKTEPLTKVESLNTIAVKPIAVKPQPEPLAEKAESDIEQAKKEIHELTETLKRLQSDFENYKKRAEKEKQEITEHASVLLAEKLLPIIDSFEQALKHCKTDDEFSKGIKLVHNQLCKTLEKEGLQKINAKGQRFDPFRHEVLLQDSCAELDDEIITDEVQPGYCFKGKVIRSSKVKINKKPAGSKKDAE